MTIQTVTVNIDGMTCENCVKSVHNVVSKIEGIESLSVSLEHNKATVSFDDSLASAQDIVSAIDDAGFEAAVASS